MMLYLLLYVTVFFINSSIGNIYYVIPSNQTCRTGQVCHNISYYTKFDFRYDGDIILIFPKGQHILNETLVIHGRNSVTLKGQDQLTYDSYWLIVQSTVINGGIDGNGQIIISGTKVYMKGLTFKNMHLMLTSKQNVLIYSMSLQSISSIVRGSYVTVIDTTLDNTNCKYYWCTGMLLIFTCNDVDVTNIIHNVTVHGVSSRKVHDVKLQLWCH